MLKFFASLTFLYVFCIIILLVYGFFYYRSFEKKGYVRKRFPYVFTAIGLACFFFIGINFYAPFSLQTISNLDHHFLQHDGFLAKKRIELGKTDTANGNAVAYNRFLFEKNNDHVTVASSYSEDPLYAQEKNSFKLLSKKLPATGHVVKTTIDNQPVEISAVEDDLFKLSIAGKVVQEKLKIKRGATAFTIFSANPEFVQSEAANNVSIEAFLKSVYIVRDNVTRRSGEGLYYFIAGKVFASTSIVEYDQQRLTKEELSFTSPVPDRALLAWGIGFLENNRNQFYIQYEGSDSFLVKNRYPVAYPLTEEERQDWKQKTVSKFLLSTSRDMLNVPAVFKEGFLFDDNLSDSTTRFQPLLLSYKKGAANTAIDLQVGSLTGKEGSALVQRGNQLLLPTMRGEVFWNFSITNTYDWHFATATYAAKEWSRVIIGSMLIFFLLILVTSIVKPAEQQSWIWQVMSSVILILLSTRFFLYWRYKSFPPYEGMDLPSQQQLGSTGNFYIIVAATLVVALFLGSYAVRYFYDSLLALLKKLSKGKLGQPHFSNKIFLRGERAVTATTKSIDGLISKKVFFISWVSVLFISGATAAINNFDPGICRHLAIGLVIVYFLFLYYSYRFSPLVTTAGKSWWKLTTKSAADLLLSNPVKILLSVSLMALFAFIDIGFAIVFLNFLFFNEAFLCINYSIAGLSAGSSRNAGIFGVAGLGYMACFVLNLLYAPYIFSFLLNLSQGMYIAGYIVFAISLAYVVAKLLAHLSAKKRSIISLSTAVALFAVAFFFFPKERIIKKAAVTKYRIDVLTAPVDKAIAKAYEEGSTYNPVIRAAQNQWFINTFIHDENNPAAMETGFVLLPHAPQNKGAKYNAQATDLVASRFLIAEHGMNAVLLYVLLLALPVTMLASFYKLYPDFTNRINHQYPVITTGFSILNYLLITALLVILAATGRYIFFGQDLPFGSILSKQSILFPTLLFVAIVWLFKQVPLMQYANRKKLVPATLLVGILTILLFVVKPVFNKNKEFSVDNISSALNGQVQLYMQPVLDYFDTARATRRLPLIQKDKLFTDSIRKLYAAGFFSSENKFFEKEVNAYLNAGYGRHRDERRMLYLSTRTGTPQLAVNDNYFRVEAPPHLQQVWKGNVTGDSTIYNLSWWDVAQNKEVSKRLYSHTMEPEMNLSDVWRLSFRAPKGNNFYEQLYLFNKGKDSWEVGGKQGQLIMHPGDSMLLSNPDRLLLINVATKAQQVVVTEPDAFMKNFYVNGSRYYVYPLAERFIWARNFSEAVAADYTRLEDKSKSAVISFDYEMTDSLTRKIQAMLLSDSSYKNGAEYGICVVDGNGRIVAAADYSKGLQRPDPNDKRAFQLLINRSDEFVPQSFLRKQIGNLNFLRMNPGPGSTLKPVVFAAVASQVAMDWNAFAAEGFSEKQTRFGGEKVAEYDFEQNNGRVQTITDYLRYSDNYYHANVLLLGSYPRQSLSDLLRTNFVQRRPAQGFSWPYFSYQQKQYWLDGFTKWPGYANGTANFGLDSSFTAIGLNNNFDIFTRSRKEGIDVFKNNYDSLLYQNAWRRSGFILPEYALFDQYGENINHKVPYDLFLSCFRGHVKGSSQVMIPPVKMNESFGRIISQNKNYRLTLNPYAIAPEFAPFQVDESIAYNSYLNIMRDGVLTGMNAAIFSGTASVLGSALKNGAPYYYYGKTGTTGDDEKKTKSKLFCIVISSKDASNPAHNFRDNRFYTVYFTSQNGPARQNEKFQAEIVKYIENSTRFNRYMKAEK